MPKLNRLLEFAFIIAFVFSFPFFAGAQKGKKNKGVWQLSGGHRQGMAGLYGNSKNGGVTLSGGCNVRLGPGFTFTIVNYRGVALQRKDDKSEPVIFQFSGGQGQRSFRHKMHYYAPEKAWVITGMLPVSFLNAMAQGNVLTIRNSKGKFVTSFNLSGTARAVRIMRRVCKM